MEAEEASFSTDILSMSAGLIWLPVPSPTGTPSTTNSGWLLPTVLTPRMRMDTGPPGVPSTLVICTPDTLPWMAASGVATGSRTMSAACTVPMDSVSLRVDFWP